MSGTRKPVQSPRRDSRRVTLMVRRHTCVACPACGTETCKTLQDLGMYCDTAIAATEASRASWAEAAARKKSVVA